MSRSIGWLAGMACVVFGVCGAWAWQEADFTPRPIVAYPFQVSDDPAEALTVIGSPQPYTIAKGDTLLDVARHVGLGVNEVKDAFAGVDLWLPPAGQTLPLPTWWVLPESDHQGIVVNIPEMRLYYFPPSRGAQGTVITYPVGLGRDDWQTPVGRFKVTEKTVDPTWVIPESIRAEHIRERGDPRKLIPGGDPDNPLGRYRMRLTLPLYGIHGTNIPWGVGMQVSHGCIRLYPEDIERFFPLVPVGTSGEFVYQPVKVGARQGRIFIEVHRSIYDDNYDYWNEARELIRNKGWDDYVDWGRVAEALDRKTGVPTRVSDSSLLPSRPRAPGVTEAHLGVVRKLHEVVGD